MKIAVLMSGGVDSSIAALLLKEEGYDIAGLTMINWDPAAVEQAAAAAHYLGISHQVVDLSKIFYEKVINNFCRSYEKGLTPNPCAQCNKHIKFGALLDYALQKGFDKVATGHYAQVELDCNRDRYLLKKGIDKGKDQSYFLYGLKQQQLAASLFPLGRLKKTEVVEMAREIGIKGVVNPESQEICFIKDDYREFLQDKVEYLPGKVVDIKGNILGDHRGLPFYTIGQRRGLGISAGQPIYVIALDGQNNCLIVGDEKDLYHDCLLIEDNNFIYQDQIAFPIQVEAKIRYASKPASAQLEKAGDDRMQLTFASPQRAITAGQSAVYYLNDYVLGGGIIV